MRMRMGDGESARAKVLERQGPRRRGREAETKDAAEVKDAETGGTARAESVEQVASAAEQRCPLNASPFQMQPFWSVKLVASHGHSCRGASVHNGGGRNVS
eukprot:322523-Pleurochrysis_carterae.AAC.1